MFDALTQYVSGSPWTYAFLFAVAALDAPMQRVAGLQPQLAAVADLRHSMDELATLREPMTQLARLREPMVRLGALSALLVHPYVLLGLALFALAAWAGVTFVAVRLAVLSALRASGSRV